MATEPVAREQEVRKTDQIITRMMELWPLWVVLAGGLVTAINFYNTVRDLAGSQKAWQAGAEQRRKTSDDELDAVKLDIKGLQKDVEWLKELRREHAQLADKPHTR